MVVQDFLHRMTCIGVLLLCAAICDVMYCRYPCLNYLLLAHFLPYPAEWHAQKELLTQHNGDASHPACKTEWCTIDKAEPRLSIQAAELKGASMHCVEGPRARASECSCCLQPIC